MIYSFFYINEMSKVKKRKSELLKPNLKLMN